jgi:hypothetical protein
MTDALGGLGGLIGTVIGAGLAIYAIDVLMDRRTGRYYDRNTGQEISREEAEHRRGQESSLHMKKAESSKKLLSFT